MTCLQLCVLFNFQIRVTFSPVFMNIFFQVEVNPVQMRCQSLYSAVMVNAKLDYSQKRLEYKENPTKYVSLFLKASEPC